MPFKKRVDTFSKWNPQHFSFGFVWFLANTYLLLWFIVTIPLLLKMIINESIANQPSNTQAIQVTRLDYRAFASRILRRADRSVTYIPGAREGVENPWPLVDFQGAPFLRWTIAFLFLFFPRFPLVLSPFFLLSAHIRWRIVQLKRVLLTNGSLFLSVPASSFFSSFPSLFLFLSWRLRSVAAATAAAINVGDGIPIGRLEETMARQRSSRPERLWRTCAEKSRESYESHGRVRGRGASFSGRKKVVDEEGERRSGRKGEKFSRTDLSPRRRVNK